MAIHRFCVIRTGCTLVALAALLGMEVAQGATSTYVQITGTSGTWNGNANWASGDLPAPPAPGSGSGPVPHAAGDTAIFQQRVTSSTSGTTVQINLATANETVGAMIVRNTDNDYTTSFITNTANLIFDNGANPAMFTEALGTSSSSTSRTRFNVPVVMNSNLKIEQDHNLTRNTATEFTQQLTAGPTLTLTKTGLGSLQFAYGGASDGFQGSVDIQQGDIRLIDGTTNFSNITSVFKQAQSILVENNTQFQLGNTITNFNIASGGEVKINGLGNSNSQTSFADGALRFEQSAGSGVICNFNSPVRMQTTSKIYVTAADTTAILTQELRGDGTAGLTKGGLGLLKLTTASANGNPYTGTTNVSTGTLAVDNTVSTASGVGSGNLNVAGGSALGGFGYIGTAANPSNVSLTTGNLYPGELAVTTGTGALITSPGVLTIRGNLNFDSASTLNMDVTGTTVGTQYDQVSEHGTVSLGGAGLNVNFGSYVPTGTETFNLIDNAGAQPVSGVFGAINGVAGTYTEGAAVTFGSTTYHITYAGGANHNDVMLIGGAAPVGVPGDFNGNGVVDMADYVLWRNGGPLQNEISDIGTVTAQDYTDWRAHFGNTSGSGSALGSSSAVPEPTSALLALFGVAALLVNSRKR